MARDISCARRTARGSSSKNTDLGPLCKTAKPAGSVGDRLVKSFRLATSTHATASCGEAAHQVKVMDGVDQNGAADALFAAPLQCWVFFAEVRVWLEQGKLLRKSWGESRRSERLCPMSHVRHFVAICGLCLAFKGRGSNVLSDNS